MVDGTAGATGATGTEAPRDEGAREGARRDARWRTSDPIRQGLGVLSALKDALDETIREARERGDLAPERAKEAVRSAFARAQEAAGEARERFDFIPRSEYERLREQVEEMRVRLENLERRAAQGPGAGEARPEGS
jgi:polyhydroxyalkanoate synthesis regulator phasin